MDDENSIAWDCFFSDQMGKFDFLFIEDYFNREADKLVNTINVNINNSVKTAEIGIISMAFISLVICIEVIIKDFYNKPLFGAIFTKQECYDLVTKHCKPRNIFSEEQKLFQTILTHINSRPRCEELPITVTIQNDQLWIDLLSIADKRNNIMHKGGSVNWQDFRLAVSVFLALIELRYSVYVNMAYFGKKELYERITNRFEINDLKRYVEND